MGAKPWDHFVPYQENISAALKDLREREFRAGHFRGADLSPPSIEDALSNAGADGTASILDIVEVADEPGFGCMAPLPNQELVSLFGTEHPTRAQIMSNMGFYADIERGEGVYIVAYKDGAPSEIFFGGYSCD
jgi:hypothetical protein